MPRLLAGLLKARPERNSKQISNFFKMNKHWSNIRVMKDIKIFEKTARLLVQKKFFVIIQPNIHLVIKDGIAEHYSMESL